MSATPVQAGPQGGRTNLDDWRGVGELIAIATEELIAPVEGMHIAIIDRWLSLGGPTLETARRTAGGLTASVYKTVRFGGSAIGAAVSIGSELASGRVPLRPVWETRRGRYVQSIVNGIMGDRLEDRQSKLRIEPGLRDSDGTPIAISSASLTQAFPQPTGRLVLLLHGLGETERCWNTDFGSPLPESLKADGFSVLRLRYNSGRAVSDNASAIADLLEDVLLEWPVPVQEIALIGHSMGGLVADSAVVAARSSGYAWADLTTHLVAIGTPHLGSPIEKGVGVIGTSLGLFKETRPFAEFLEGRSAGIKDLRHGVDSRPEGVQHHAVAGVVTTEPAHPFGVLVGDLVVRVKSALGSKSNDRAETSSALVVGGRHHGDLVHDPEVASHIRTWLGPAPSGQTRRRHFPRSK